MGYKLLNKNCVCSSIDGCMDCPDVKTCLRCAPNKTIDVSVSPNKCVDKCPDNTIQRLGKCELAYSKDGLAAYYPLYGDVKDASGNGKHATAGS